jgi:hypothetical protein
LNDERENAGFDFPVQEKISKNPYPKKNIMLK